MLRKAVRALKQQQLEKTPLTPYICPARTHISWSLTENLKKKAVTAILQVCHSDSLDWNIVYRGGECSCSIESLAPSSLYLFRLKVFGEQGSEAATKWSETVSYITRDEAPSVLSLHRAIQFGNHQEVQKTLQNIPIAACRCFSDAGLTSLQTAVTSSDLKMVKMLLQHCDVNAKSSGDERTALMMAAAIGKVDAVRLLLENGADLEIQDKNGLRALHHATGHATITELILDAGAAVDAEDCCGWTPLMRAGNLIANLYIPTLARFISHLAKG